MDPSWNLGHKYLAELKLEDELGEISREFNLEGTIMIGVVRDRVEETDPRHKQCEAKLELYNYLEHSGTARRLDVFGLLGIEDPATITERQVNKCYIRTLQKCHPDRAQALAEHYKPWDKIANEVTKKIGEAKEMALDYVRARDRS
jgi:hypothetical protein